jgi:hypothetical protein
MEKFHWDIRTYPRGEGYLIAAQQAVVDKPTAGLDDSRESDRFIAADAIQEGVYSFAAPLGTNC